MGPERAERPPVKLPDLDVQFIPEEKGVESLARQIKLTGRAYPLFEIAYLVLKKPERYHIQLNSKKNTEGQPVQGLYVCGLDDTVWLSEQEAMTHVLDKHFSTFYEIEKIPTDPPKGTYTFVAQCGMSGAILGPPNYHDYQNKLRKLHQERFARMPFDAFKSRIKIVRDEEVVKKWLEEQSFRMEYTCLNIPEALKFQSREEVEKHFRETHLPNVTKQVDTYTMAAGAVHEFPNRTLQMLVRREYDQQMRFPLKVVNILSQQFARQGLQFFKVNKTITHVAVARPHYLDMETTPVSEGVKKIVHYIGEHPRTTRKQMIEALAPEEAREPGAAPTEAQPQKAAPAEPRAEASPEAAAPPAETPSAEAPAEPGAQPEAGAAAAPAEAAPAAPAVHTGSAISNLVSDLHWLIHQGHVIEFASGALETAKKPVVKPPKPPKAPKQKQEPAKPEGESKPEGEAKSEEGSAEGASAAEAQGEQVQGEPAQQPSAAEPSPADQPAQAAANEQPPATGEIKDESGASAGAQVSEQAPQPSAEGTAEDPNKNAS